MIDRKATRPTIHPALDVSSWDDATPDPGLIIADGPNVTITVRGNPKGGAMLVIKDGPGGKRVRELDKVPAVINTIVILADHGFVTLEAETYMANQGIQWAHIETNGGRIRTLSTSGAFADGRLMRLQGMLAEGYPLHEAGLIINRRLIAEKLEGQAWNCADKLDNEVAAKQIRECADALAVADTVEEIRAVEGRGAKIYWQAWKGYPVRWSLPAPFAPRWHSFSERRTLLYDWESNKDATDPINAMLNFAYHVAEIECTLALHRAHLSPVMGISHTDQDKRDSMSLDLVEVLRPWADAAVLAALDEAMDMRNFVEYAKDANGKHKDGVIKLEAPLTHTLANAVHGLRSKLQPAIKFMVETLEANDPTPRKAASQPARKPRKG